MPIIVPPFVPYQAPLIPIRGLWNNPPPEGDRFIPVEIDWGVTTGLGMAVQLSISAFSPVEFSQVCAFNVDNGRNGSDVDFLFPDTGRQLTVPAYCQGLFPVISNAMTFYVVSIKAAVGDITVFEICNSVPPPVSVLPSQEQQSASVSGMSLTANATFPLIAAGITGTLNTIVLTFTGASTTAGSAVISLVDGQGTMLWQTAQEFPAGPVTFSIPVPGLRLRFINGLNLVVSSSTGLTAAGVNANLFYTVP